MDVVSILRIYSITNFMESCDGRRYLVHDKFTNTKEREGHEIFLN